MQFSECNKQKKIFKSSTYIKKKRTLGIDIIFKFLSLILKSYELKNMKKSMKIISHPNLRYLIKIMFLLSFVLYHNNY